MNIEGIISQRFLESINSKQKTLETSLKNIADAAKLMRKILENGNKILVCGNGGSAADSQHLAAELIMRYETNRTSLPAIALNTDTSALTAISNDLDFENVFARQVEGLAQTNDLLVAISTSGNSANVLKAIKVAQKKSMFTIALTGGSGGKIGARLGKDDIEIRVADIVTGRIQETHTLIIHCLCEIMDLYFTS